MCLSMYCGLLGFSANTRSLIGATLTKYIKAPDSTPSKSMGLTSGSMPCCWANSIIALPLAKSCLKQVSTIQSDRGPGVEASWNMSFTHWGRSNVNVKYSDITRAPSAHCFDHQWGWILVSISVRPRREVSKRSEYFLVRVVPCCRNDIAPGTFSPRQHSQRRQKRRHQNPAGQISRLLPQVFFCAVMTRPHRYLPWGVESAVFLFNVSPHRIPDGSLFK
jgi:hypothetical protein